MDIKIKIPYGCDRKVEVVVFDLDGTILNTLQDLTNAANRSLEAFRYPIHEETVIQSFVGDGVAMLMRRAAPDNLMDEEHSRLLEYFRKYYDEHLWEKTQPYPGCEDFLHKLQYRGIPMIVYTNKPQAQAERLINHFFPGIFAAVIGQADHRPKKPDAGALLEFLQEVYPYNHDCLYLGDSDVDMQTAKNAGAIACGVTWGFRTAEVLQASGADFLVSDFTQLSEFLQLGR